MNAPGRAATQQQPCTYQLGACARTDTRPYQVGGRWRCPDHTPARLAGRPEPDSARYCPPAICYCQQCTGKRRTWTPITGTVVNIRTATSGRTGRAA